MTKDTFIISRTFDAPRDLVWAVYTQPEHILHWWAAPGTEPLSCEMDLRPGGVFHYGMKAVDGSVIWGKWVIQAVTPPERLVAITSFSDENGGVCRHPMAPVWPLETWSETLFEEADGRTTMTLRWTPHKAAPEESQVFADSTASMTGGWTHTLNNLDTYLRTLTQ